MQQTAGISPKNTLKLRLYLRNEVQGLQHLVVGDIAHFGKGFGTDHCPDRERIVRVQYLTGFIRGQELFDLFRFGQVDLFDRVGEDKPVHAHHHRYAEFLRDAKRLHVQVRGLLVVFSKQLQPSGITLAHRVAVVIPDIDRRTDGSVRHGHYDGKAQTGSVIHGLDHIEQTL